MILDSFKLDGRVAAVTGAASGLGRSFAIALAEAGARVACIDRDREPLAETIRLIGPAALELVADVSDEDEVDQVARQIRAWGEGGLDILVNNAGIATPPGRLLEVSVADWDRGVAVNLRSVFLCTRALLPELLASGRGSIINLSSFLGLVGLHPGAPMTAIPYASTKAAIVGFTRQLAAEYAREQLRVNAIAPGWHGGTNLARERAVTLDEQGVARFEAFIRDSVPMGRRGSPEELAGLLLYLASDASSYVTGQVFAHDGGLTAV